MDLNLFYCKHCKKIVAVLENPEVPTVCCGEPMRPLTASMTDGSAEKHVPQVQISDNRIVVTVGEKAHPMEKDHYIQWILIETNRGEYRKFLHPGEVPKADFYTAEGEKVKTAYCYCNLHKLWKNDLV